MKPYLICHMLASVDGKIISSRWPGAKNAADIFESSAATIKSDGWIVGRKTMSEFSAQKPRRKRNGRFAVAKTDYIAPHDQKTYAIALDPSGKLSWDKNHVDTEHVVTLLTEKVSGEYLDYLRGRGVSYVFAGKSGLDLKRALTKLHKLLGVKRLTLQGGGLNNGSFLNAGLVDELSLIVAPFADGEMGIASVFDIPHGARRGKAAKLKLVSSRRYKKEYLWLRYKVENR